MQIATFNFNSQEVRTATNANNEPYFCLIDVANILELSNSRKTAQLDEKGIAKIAINTKGGQQEVTFINEPNLYRVIFRSNKAEAVKFQNWVFDEVLPSIRKNGSYSQRQTISVEQRYPLDQAVKLLARTKGLSYSDAWKLVHQRFGVDSVKKLTLDQLEQAVCYVHSLLMIQNNPEQLYDTLANSAIHLRDYARMLKILKHLPMTDDNTGGNIYRQITETFDDIVKLSHTMNLRNHAGRPMFEQNRINYYRGNALVW